MMTRNVSRLLLLSLLVTLVQSCRTSSDPFQLDPETPVVLVVIDTLRADHLGCYGYELETSPNIDRFAALSTVFESNSTQLNSTFGSLTSILTGLFVKSHKMFLAVPTEEAIQAGGEGVGLSERLKRRGHRTISVVSHPAFDDQHPDAVLMRGWDRFSTIDTNLNPLERNRLDHGEHTNERTFPLLDEHRDTAPKVPLFLWAHYFEPHSNQDGYEPPPHTRDLFTDHHFGEIGEAQFGRRLRGMTAGECQEQLDTVKGIARHRALSNASHRAMYDAEILSCDAAIGALFARLAEDDLFDRALIIVAGDHGENMGNKSGDRQAGPFTHTRLYEGVVRTPLIVKLPGQREGARLDSLTQNIDIAPTIIDLLGLPDEAPTDGESLVPLLRGTEREVHEMVFMESSDGLEKAARTRNHKYIDPRRDGQPPMLFRWRTDPGERENLIGTADAAVVDRFRDALWGFTPVSTVHVLCEPRETAYSVDLEVELMGGILDGVVGPVQSTISDDGRVARVKIQIEDVPVKLMLMRRLMPFDVHYRVSMPGEARPDLRVHIGSHPLTSTDARPVWVTRAGAPPASPQLEIEHHSDGGVRATLHPPAGTTGRLRVRYAAPSYRHSLRLVSAEGFAMQGDDAAPRYEWVMTTSGDRSTASFSHAGEAGDVMTTSMINGRWPDPTTVAVDGRPVRTDRCEFVIPARSSRRLRTQIATPPDETAAPTGRIIIWQSAGNPVTSIDTTKLDAETIRQLQELGYVR